MKRYVKKPIVIEAEKWLKVDKDVIGGKYHLEVGYFRHPHVPKESKCKHCEHTMHDHGWIDTLEGGHIVCPGDWIIRGIAGEMYPCKPDIFNDTYEEVEE